MSGLSSLPWSMEQQRMLAAMGYTLYRPLAQPSDAKVVTVAPGLEATISADRADSRQRERLWSALRRAAGDRDVSALVPDIEALSRDPLLKRALWPRLRALRRADSGRPGSHDRRP